MEAIRTESLVKEFGGIRAVDSIDIEVAEGEIYGFLGVNGAGKSTTMMILSTLLKPTSGRAFVAGHDVVAEPSAVRSSIGYVQQDTAVDEFLTGRENLVLQARLNRLPAGQRRRRIDEMLEMTQLAGRADDATLTYSGGMRKRLDIACGLLHNPRVLFLDEPTVGLDIQTRRKIWEYIRRIHSELGTTIFLTTHYMEEADRLCGRVGIIDGGRIMAVGRPSELKASLGADVIMLSLRNGGMRRLAESVGSIPSVRDTKSRGEDLVIYTSQVTEVIPQVFSRAESVGAQISSMRLQQPTLDDVFVSFTGREIRDEPEARFDRKKAHRRSRELRM